MSYLVLARKWRPQAFDDLIGQQPIVRILTNSIDQGKIAHAYVFSGPRGVGKTSTARILAKSLNCISGPTPSPCGQCPSCLSIAEGSSVDVIEIDGASNNSVDDIRDLRDRVKYAPSGGKSKVYIIDEAHMLSQSAFNALLKTLEEPPPHVVFVLATTEARKIPLTVMSRCQHLPFRRISTRDIKDRLRQISGTEGINITDQAVSLVARAADGSIRDSLTILDQVASFTSDIEESDVISLLDVSDFGALSEVADAIIEARGETIIRLVGDLFERGTDLRAFTKDLIRFFRDLLVAKLVPSPQQSLDLGDDEIETIVRISGKTSEEYLTLMISELIRAESDVKSSFSPSVALEMSLLKASYLSRFKDIGRAIEALYGSKPPSGSPTTPSDPPVSHREQRASPAPSGGAENNAETNPVSETGRVPETTAGPDIEHTGESLVKAVSARIKDTKVSSYLTMARGELKDDRLLLTFNSSEADICAKPFKDDPSVVEGIASELLGRPIALEIHVSQSKTMGKKELKKKVMSEPLVREALELFDGRVVDIKQSKDT